VNRLIPSYLLRVRELICKCLVEKMQERKVNKAGRGALAAIPLASDWRSRGMIMCLPACWSPFEDHCNITRRILDYFRALATV
jgi:hypothetical protein